MSVLVGFGYGLAHFVENVVGPFAVPHDVVNVAVFGRKGGVVGVHILVVQAAVGVVVVGDEHVAGYKIGLVAQPQVVIGTLVVVGLAQIQQIVERPEALFTHHRQHIVDRVADDVVFA